MAGMVKLKGECQAVGNRAGCAYEVDWRKISDGYEWKATYKRGGRVAGTRIGTTYAAPGLDPESIIRAEVERAFNGGVVERAPHGTKMPGARHNAARRPPHRSRPAPAKQ